MSNKTSDKNVGDIEELIKEYKTYNDLDGIQDLQPYIRALQNILADYTRQKQINEDHRKLNGELRERVKELEEELEGLKNINKNQGKDITKAVDYTFELNKELENKDKQIDLMANYIVNLIKYNNPEEIREVEEIKQYFERKIEK